MSGMNNNNDSMRQTDPMGDLEASDAGPEPTEVADELHRPGNSFQSPHSTATQQHELLSMLVPPRKAGVQASNKLRQHFQGEYTEHAQRSKAQNSAHPLSTAPPLTTDRQKLIKDLQNRMHTSPHQNELTDDGVYTRTIAASHLTKMPGSIRLRSGPRVVQLLFNTVKHGQPIIFVDKNDNSRTWRGRIGIPQTGQRAADVVIYGIVVDFGLKLGDRMTLQAAGQRDGMPAAIISFTTANGRNKKSNNLKTAQQRLIDETKQSLQSESKNNSMPSQIDDDGTVTIGKTAVRSQGWRVRKAFVTLLFPSLNGVKDFPIDVVLIDGEDGVRTNGALTKNGGNIRLKAGEMLRHLKLSVSDRVTFKSAGIVEGKPAVTVTVLRKTEKAAHKKNKLQRPVQPPSVQQSQPLATISSSDDEMYASDGVNTMTTTTTASSSQSLRAERTISAGHKRSLLVSSRVADDTRSSKVAKTSAAAPPPPAQQQQQQEHQHEEEEPANRINSFIAMLAEIKALLQVAGMPQTQISSFQLGFSNLSFLEQFAVMEALRGMKALGNEAVCGIARNIMKSFR